MSDPNQPSFDPASPTGDPAPPTGQDWSGPAAPPPAADAWQPQAGAVWNEPAPGHFPDQGMGVQPGPPPDSWQGQPGPPMPRPSSNGAKIAIIIVVGVVVLLLVAAGAIWAAVSLASDSEGADGELTGVVDYFKEDPDLVAERDHTDGVVDYTVKPPVAGEHNVAWQTCNGVVYSASIPSEHAVHSLEHGAVWITYRSDVPADQVQALADRVTGRDYTLMSVYEDMDSPISLQAWGYQLKVDSADDERIDQFIKAYRLTASQEPGATCSGGVSITGDTPLPSP